MNWESDDLKKLLFQHFGFQNFRTPQKEIISSLLNARDTIAILPTGKGKSLCYQLPACIFPYCSVIISPLLALMYNQVTALQIKNIPAAAITSETSSSEKERIFQDCQQKKISLLYLSPEQLSQKHTRQHLLTLPISHVCIDEAHCVSTWGHDFRPAYNQITAFIDHYTKKYPRPIISAFTATASRKVYTDITTILPLQNPNLFQLPYDRPNLHYQVISPFSEASKRRLLCHRLTEYLKTNEGKCLMYVATRKDADFYASWLQQRGFPAQSFHAKKSSPRKAFLLDWFSTTSPAILLATSAFGMGIDIPDIRVVIHLTAPTNLAAYAQESGRAGRDGKPSTCLLFFRTEELNKTFQYFLSPQLAQRSQQQKEAMTLYRWATKSPCLQTGLKKYFEL